MNSSFHGDFPSCGPCCRKLQATWKFNIATQFLLKPFGMGYPSIYAHKYKMHRHHFFKSCHFPKGPSEVELLLKTINLQPFFKHLISPLACMQHYFKQLHTVSFSEYMRKRSALRLLKGLGFQFHLPLGVFDLCINYACL